MGAACAAGVGAGCCGPVGFWVPAGCWMSVGVVWEVPPPAVVPSGLVPTGAAAWSGDWPGVPPVDVPVAEVAVGSGVEVPVGAVPVLAV